MPKVQLYGAVSKQLASKQQNHIDHHHVEMASIAMINFGLDSDKFVCFLAGEYTGHH
jgi:hypothetical protein